MTQDARMCSLIAYSGPNGWSASDKPFLSPGCGGQEPADTTSTETRGLDPQLAFLATHTTCEEEVDEKKSNYYQKKRKQW